jgi:hypothetical protein
MWSRVAGVCHRGRHVHCGRPAGLCAIHRLAGVQEGGAGQTDVTDGASVCCDHLVISYMVTVLCNVAFCTAVCNTDQNVFCFDLTEFESSFVW